MKNFIKKAIQAVVGFVTGFAFAYALMFFKGIAWLNVVTLASAYTAFATWLPVFFK